MNQQKGFIRYIVIIITILVVVFLSQQPQFKFVGKNISTQSSKYLANAQTWVKTNLWPKVGREASSLQSSATANITQQKNNAVQNLWENFKNYFAEKFNKTFGTKVQ